MNSQREPDPNSHKEAKLEGASPLSASQVGSDTSFTSNEINICLSRPTWPKAELNPFEQQDRDITPNTDIIGGRLRLYKNEWQNITSDIHILEAISAYRLDFEHKPPSRQPRPPRPYKLNKEERKAVDEEIDKLLKKGVIEISKYEDDQFISNIFTRPKKDGGYRMILDLSELNEYISYNHFKMETFETARSLITSDCYMASLDLRDAYYSVPIAKCDRKYLKFYWNNTLYNFTALPNGLSSGPRLFTKILKPPLAQLRSIGHVITAYIDDSLLVAQTKDQAATAVQDSAQMLEHLGFIVHPKKSVFKPTQEIEYLGFVINSRQMKVFLPDLK